MKDVNILINNGANIKKALELFGDMETYDATLETFLQEVPSKLEKIRALKEIGDMANYAILVHSLKSDARYFGFEELGEIAYQHELKSKENDMYYVTEHFVELWPGCEGLVHVSQLDSKRVEKPSDVVKVGDEILVKSLGFDKRGRLNLSRKKALKKGDENE